MWLKRSKSQDRFCPVPVAIHQRLKETMTDLVMHRVFSQRLINLQTGCLIWWSPPRKMGILEFVLIPSYLIGFLEREVPDALFEESLAWVGKGQGFHYLWSLPWILAFVSGWREQFAHNFWLTICLIPAESSAIWIICIFWNVSEMLIFFYAWDLKCVVNITYDNAGLWVPWVSWCCWGQPWWESGEVAWEMLISWDSSKSWQDKAVAEWSSIHGTLTNSRRHQGWPRKYQSHYANVSSHWCRRGVLIMWNTELSGRVQAITH